jgi:hypothetical protein
MLSQIVPGLHPQSDPVGDYALNLAIQLRERYGVQTRFIVCDPRWDGPSRIEGFVVRRLRVRNEAGIWCLLAAAKEPNASVLLHYTGYGYDKLGMPFWLDRGIGSWLNELAHGAIETRKHFSTIFHELWSSNGKPWKRGFFLCLFQRWLISRLHRRSRYSVVSTLRMRRVLDGIKPRKTIWLPMPSNLPSTGDARTGDRTHGSFRVAIFDQPNARRATLNAHSNLLRDLDQKNKLASVTLMGRGLNTNGTLASEIELLQSSLARAPIQILGELSPAQVALSLRRSDLFLSSCRAEAACKSGTVMAALAAGCPSVLRDGEDAAPLNENEHFLASDDSPQSVKRLEETAAEGHLPWIGTAGQSWYHRYADWKVVAHQYKEAIFDNFISPDSSAVFSLPVESPPHPWTQLACPSTD